MNVKPIPDGYHTITPYLVIQGVAQTIGFLKAAFGAEEIDHHSLPDGTITNAEVKVGNSMVMLGEKHKDQKSFPAMLYLYVDDVDSVFKKAVQAGGKIIREVSDQPYGDRMGGVEDSAGNQWWVATRKENVSGEELMQRLARNKNQ
jgi:PhnB protein